MKPVKYIVVFICLFIFSDNLFAQNYNDALRLSEIGIGSNARALGMGNAYTALSDDYSAASFNPAGFGLLKRMEFAGGIHYSKYTNNTTFFGSETDYSNSATKLNQFSFAFPFPTIRGSFVLAAGYSRDRDFNQALSFNGYNNSNNSMIQDLLGDGDVSYLLFLTDDTGSSTPINGRLNQEGEIISSGGIGKWSFSGAMEVSKNVFAGATFNIISGTFRRTRDYYEDDVNDVYGTNVQTVPGDARTADFQSFYFNDVIDWDIAGWDAKVGILFQTNKLFRVGATIKFPTSYTIKENYVVNGRSEFGSGSIFTIDPPLESDVEYEITTPFVFNGGVSVNYKGLIVSGDASYIDYSQMEFNSGLAALDISNNNKDIKNLFTGVMNLNAGAEYTFAELGLRLRGGFIYHPSPFKDDPTDYDRKYITGGIGFLVDETVAIDAAYAHGWWKDFGDNYGTNVSRTLQDISYNNFVITFSYRF